MTFILSHAEALERYRPVYAGSRRVPGLALPDARVATANRGGLLGPLEEFMFRRFGMASRLADDLRRHKPGLVHAHFGQSGPAGLALADALGVPLIVTFHGQDATITREQAKRSWRGREYLRGRERVIRQAGLIIAVSEFIRARLVENGYPAERVVTHRNGIDVKAFNSAAGGREPVALFIGRFVEKKGCEFLLRALGRLREQRRPVRGVLIGDGPLRTDLERLAAQVGADVSFTGFLPLPEVRRWLARALVAVVPSVTAANGNSEGLPTVILEAQAMSTPVVTTRHAGNAEGVLEGRTALLVEERDAEGLAHAIRQFLDNPALVTSFGAEGRRFVEANFEIGGQVRGLEDLYDRARAGPSWRN